LGAGVGAHAGAGNACREDAVNPVATTSRDRRVLAAGVAAIVALLGVARGLPTLRQWQSESRDSASVLVQEVARVRTTMARDHATRDSLAARQERFIALAPLLLRGETPAMGGAILASLISTAATAASVRLGPVQVHADTAARGVFSRVGARAEITGDVHGVGAFLSILERGPTLLAVRELTISQLEPAAAPDRAEALHVALTVDALMLTPRPPTAQKAARAREPGRKAP
jgi:hypothetical protein